MKHTPRNGERRAVSVPSRNRGAEPPNSRRRSKRRKTYDLRILATDTETGQRWTGWVLDSSRDGLRVKLIGPIPPIGAVLKIHRFHTPKLDASLVARVVHGKCFDHETSCWLVGCEFAEPPQPGILVHFT